MKEIENQEIVSYDKIKQEVIVRTKRRKIMGPFSAISKLSNVNNKTDNDIFDRLNQVSKGALAVFTSIKSRRNENNNFAGYDTSDFSKTHKETFSRHLMELRKQNIVRRAGRVMIATNPRRPYQNHKQTYMINPDLLKCWDFEDAMILWNQCKR